MSIQTENNLEILDSISGLRQYTLGKPPALIFVGQSLCDMLGYAKDELLSDGVDTYLSVIHPEDRSAYEKYIKQASVKRKSCSAEYRLIKKDGSVIYVKDTMTVKVSEGGAVGYATLSDITHIKEENDNLHFLNETVPCGMLRYTCEKNPRVTYINEQMKRMLRLSESRRGELDYQAYYRDNVYLMIPIESRRKFSHFLHRVYKSNSPMAGEMSVVRCDGTKARLFGWITKVVGKDGKEEFQSVCMDVTENYQTKRASETDRYLRALTEVYEYIFEYDLQSKTVKYVSGTSGSFSKIKNLPMHMEEATEEWIKNTVHPADTERVREFFSEFISKREYSRDERPPQIEYRAIASTGEIKRYSGIFLRVNSSICLFCCKHIIDEVEMDELKKENLALKNMHELVMRFTEGVMAFKIENGSVKPLYASDNVCNFFGYTKDEWLALAEGSCSIKNFIANSALSYEDVEMLLSTGEAEFTYFDMTQGRTRLIKAICSQKSYDGQSSCYVMLYNVDDWQASAESGGHPKIYIRTFGYFDVFVNDKPIAFRNKKAKELLALLVDRRGGYVTSEEAIGYLWEDEPANTVTLARYRKEALRLKNTLEEYGISDIIEAVDGKRRIIPEKVRCDLFDYLSSKEEYSELFGGSYLTNYAWGEFTLGQLMNRNTN
ncbi:MAG: PAS domain-containing protein [Clostridia bacterium]|nr:PAS domain-containing protein [Clostridia bacterium]